MMKEHCKYSKVTDDVLIVGKTSEILDLLTACTGSFACAD